MLDIILYTILIIIIIICIYILINFIYDYLSYKVSNDNKINNATSIINTDLHITQDNIKNLQTNMNSNLTNITRDYSNVIAINNNNIIKTIDNNNSFTSNINSNIFNFDNALKQYFIFDETNNSGTINTINTALFKYTFNNITPKKLNILSEVNAMSGITIKTAPTTTSKDNLRICDNQATTPNCLNFNLNNSLKFD